VHQQWAAAPATARWGQSNAGAARCQEEMQKEAQEVGADGQEKVQEEAEELS
jgi:hypothetical protein